MKHFILFSFLFFPLYAQKIVVIGGGLSGLVAAWRLQQKGFNVELYEARNRVGGRIFSAYLNDDIVELGAQNISDGGEAKHLHQLIDELGLETAKTKANPQMHFVQENSIFNFNELLANRFTQPLQLRAKLNELAMTCKNMKEVLDALINENDPLYQFFNVRLAAYEGGALEKLSTFYIETLYHQLQGGICAAHSVSNEDKNIHFEWIKGGNSLIPERLKEKLGERVHLNSPLVVMTKEKDYTLIFKNGERVHADIVILTIPCPVFKDLNIAEDAFPPSRKDAIASICYGTNGKIIVPLPENQLPFTSTNGKFVAFKNTSGKALNLYYLGPWSYFSEDTIQNCFNQDIAFLHKCYGIENQVLVTAKDQSFEHYTTAIGHSWPKDPFAYGSYSYIAAGQEELFTKTTHLLEEEVKVLFSPFEGLFFAGEHTSTLFNVCGTMEAAVESGEKVARMIEKL